MRWYGGHYKVNDPPLNVPATLDQIIEILPCIHSELQPHPVKLNVRLSTKVTTCMTWSTEIVSLVLSHGWKKHNSHYADIKLNEHWYNDIAAKELSVQIDKNYKLITVTEDAVLDPALQNENTSTDKLNKEDNQ